MEKVKVKITATGFMKMNETLKNQPQPKQDERK